MSAAALGKELLRAVEEEGLNEFLQSLRESHGHRTPKFGYEPLDRLLDAFQHPPLTRQQEQFYTQWSTQPQEPQMARVVPPSVVEIISSTACSGKTQLLYHLVAIALLPSTYHDVDMQGNGHAVVILDLSNKISVLRLREMMLAYIHAKSATSCVFLPESALDSLVFDSLMHLHIFRPQSSSSLLATLSSLSSYLLSGSPAHFSANRALGLLAVNDVGSFLWQDRLDADEAGLSTVHAAEPGQNDFILQRYRPLVSSLRHIHDYFSCAIVATTQGLTPVTTSFGQLALRPSMPAVWNNFCTVKVVVERERIAKFGPGMSAEEASAEKLPRWEAVERSGFSGRVNWWGSDAWRDEVREAVKVLDNGGGFHFRITDEGFDPSGYDTKP